VSVGPATGKLKQVIDVLDAEPAFTDEMLKLTRWIADYYVTSWGLVLKAALPAGIEVESRRFIDLADRSIALPDEIEARSVFEVIRRIGAVTIEQLNRHVSVPISLSKLKRYERQGWLAFNEVIGKPRVSVLTRPYVRLADQIQGGAAFDKAVAELRGAKQRVILETLQRRHQDGLGEVSKSDLLDAAGASAASLTALIEKELIVVEEREILRTPFGLVALDQLDPVRHDLHPAQREALDQITEASVQGKFQTFLLHGVTGSGKTEVYIAALKPVLERGGSGIVLVPEIALTPQTVGRFRAHFGDEVAVLHSRMSLGERYDAWRKLHEGRFRVVVGPRSAVLAPVHRLGIIIVDEEHEPSYKQFDPAPRYNARDVAVMRAHMSKAVCVLGSATPSLESYHNAARGKYVLLSMPERVPMADGVPATLPKVTRVDLAKEKMKGALEGSLSDPLRKAIQVRLDKNEQVILLQNRRGFAPVLECMSCGWVPQCRDCAVSLTLHKTRQHLRCHYCGYSERVPKKCGNCGEVEMALIGFGTQRVEEELEALFEEATILRMDLDTTSTKDAHFRILRRFESGEADVLVGTQMIAKGLDFPRVTLVGIVNADTRLLMPDFRAAEHTFALLSQVAGRSGRAELKGEVLLQTRNPRHDVIQRACKHDYLGFVRTELAERQQLQYPPFGRMIAIEFKGKEPSAAEEAAIEWTDRLREKVKEPVRVMGPEVAFIAKIKQYYRFQTLLKIPQGIDPNVIKDAIRKVDAALNFGQKVRVSIDVDPIGLL
jgi:primosomal protein N' (replication factor Y)